VIQVTFGSAFVNPQMAADTVAEFQAEAALDERNAAARAAGKPEEDEAAFYAEWKRTHPPRPTKIEAVLEQIDYGVKLVGIDHIGLGSDFDGVSGNLPDGLRSVADYPNLVAGLQARGYGDDDIRKILGGNLLRVWTAIEAGAQAKG
jgi:membrane dipeptidase